MRYVSVYAPCARRPARTLARSPLARALDRCGQEHQRDDLQDRDHDARDEDDHGEDDAEDRLARTVLRGEEGLHEGDGRVKDTQAGELNREHDRELGHLLQLLARVGRGENESVAAVPRLKVAIGRLFAGSEGVRCVLGRAPSALSPSPVQSP